MKVSGFSFIRDGVRLGYPFEESIRSALPVCDEFIIAVGDSNDDTMDRLKAMNEPKLRLIPTTWNETCRSHGYVYGQQKMIAQFNCTGDWAFYLEGDEILHEDDLDRLIGAMQHYLDDPEVEALAFDYYHFYGDTRHLHVSSHAYRKAARIIRNSVRSMAPDGLYWAVIKKKTWLGGRNKRRTRYPRAAALNIPIFHYGNARDERFLREKAEAVKGFWNDELAFQSAYGQIDPRAIAEYEGSHPAVIREWIETHANPGFQFDPDYRPTRRDKKHRIIMRLEKKFGWDLSKRHFRIIKSWDSQDV